MIFLRHPTPDAPEGLCYGRLDLDLAPGAEAEIAAALRATPRARHVVSSPAKRARILAEALAARDGLEVRFDERLWEYGFGAWEGRLWSELPREETERWMQDMWTRRDHGGDSFEAVHARVEAALRDMPEGAVAVCHAGPIRAARMILQGLSFDEVFARKVPYATPIDLRKEAAAWRASP